MSIMCIYFSRELPQVSLLIIEEISLSSALSHADKPFENFTEYKVQNNSEIGLLISLFFYNTQFRCVSYVAGLEKLKEV